MPTPRPSPAEFQAARLKGLAATNAHLGEVLAALMDGAPPPPPPALASVVAAGPRPDSIERLEAANAYLAEAVVALVDGKPQPRLLPHRFDPDQHDPEDTLPLGVRAEDLLRSVRTRTPRASKASAGR